MKNAILGISVVMAISLAGFMSDSSLDEVTGFAIAQAHEGTPVLLTGLAVDAIIDGQQAYFMLSENTWYRSDDLLSWSESAQMGESIWSGLYHLKAQEATIFYKSKQITDVEDFAKLLK